MFYNDLLEQNLYICRKPLYPWALLKHTYNELKLSHLILPQQGIDRIEFCLAPAGRLVPINKRQDAEFPHPEAGVAAPDHAQGEWVTWPRPAARLPARQNGKTGFKRFVVRHTHLYKLAFEAFIKLM